jgi:Flp pilus assembly protein TadG
VTYHFAPLFGITVMSVWGISSITMTSWMAPSLAMSAGKRHRGWTCDRGSTAVEFAIILPALAALVVGGLNTGLLIYSAVGLRTAVEHAARCFSVNASQCGTAAAAQTYAQGQSYGISTPTFTAAATGCGHQVSATVTIAVTAVVANFNVPLSATACFP